MKTLIMLITAAALPLGACHKTSSEPPPEPEEPAKVSAPSTEPVIRTYEVPAGRAEEVSRVLRRALQQGPDTPPRGTVNRLEDGRLVVLAPASVHDGIAGLCEDLEEAGDATPPPTIEISYWLVLAKPGDSGTAETIPSALAPALEEITELDGPAGFSLLESTRIASMASARGQAKGRHANIEQLATVFDGAVVANIEVEADRGSKLETRLSLQPGELVILGHAGRDAKDAPEARLYYIVRADAS